MKKLRNIETIASQKIVSNLEQFMIKSKISLQKRDNYFIHKIVIMK